MNQIISQTFACLFCSSCPNKQEVLCRAPQSESSALGLDVVGVVVLLLDQLLSQVLHLMQTVQLSLQVFLKLSLFPPQGLHLCHRVLFGHNVLSELRHISGSSGPDLPPGSDWTRRPPCCRSSSPTAPLRPGKTAGIKPVKRPFLSLVSS